MPSPKRRKPLFDVVQKRDAVVVKKVPHRLVAKVALGAVCRQPVADEPVCRPP